VARPSPTRERTQPLIPLFPKKTAGQEILMRIRYWSIVAIVMLAAVSTALAESPWVGKWKLDPSQSKLTGDTIHFASGAGGEMSYTSEGHTSKFKLDGQPYKTWSGAEGTWKKADDNTFESHWTLNGTDLGTDTWTISPDGKNLKVESKGKHPDGSSFDNTADYTRVAGKDGLNGSWKSTKADLNEDRTFEMAAEGDHGMTWTIPEMKATVSLKMDSKDYPAEGPTVPKGFTLAVTPVSSNSFKMMEKMNGMPIWHGTYTLSGDGKKMTIVGSPAKTNEPTTEVYLKQ
jgi:hypothetical protein